MSVNKNNSGVMSQMNNYVRSRSIALAKNALYQKYKDMTVENLIREYKNKELPENERKFVLETLFLKIFFYFPSFLSKKKYKLNVNLYDEALQNISHKIMDAISRFDPDKGYPFLAYAYGDMTSAMTQTFRELNLVQIPNSVRKNGLYANCRYDNPASDSSGCETDSQCSVDCFINDPEIGIAYTESPDEPSETHSDDCAADLVANSEHMAKSVLFTDADDSEHVDYDHNLHNKQLTEWLEEALSAESGILTEDERLVVTLHNGLFGNEPMIYADIAELRKKTGKGCSRSRISQIHTKALKKLRKWFRAMHVHA